MRRCWVVVIAALSLLAACGSTVPTAKRATQDGASSASGGVEAPAVAGGSDQAAGAEGGSTASGGRGGSGGRATGGGATASGGVANTGRAASVGPGVTADKVYVGLSYATSSAANTAIGAAGITQGDPRAEGQALIDYVNSHGGVGGHKVEAVWHPVDGNSTAPYDVTDQQTCDDWTQDHKIFIALATPNADSETLQSCLNSRGVIHVSDDLSSSDTSRFQRYPYYVELVSMNLDRIATAEVAALKDQGWFGGWNTTAGAAAPTKAKIGIVTYDGPTWAKAVDGTLVPALKAVGYPVDPGDIVRITPENATQDAGAVGAADSSAVLKLRGDGVTHVIVFDHAALLTLFFGRAADSQGYHPRYGLNTQNGPQALIDGAALPAEQLIGSKGIGWFPSLDLRDTDNPANGPYSNDTRRKCLAIYASKNITFSDANAESIGMNGCSSFLFLQAAVAAGGNVLNKVAFMDGVAKLGSSFLSAGNFATRFSATRHDGVGAFRHYSYDEGTGRMKYTSNPISAP